MYAGKVKWNLNFSSIHRTHKREEDWSNKEKFFYVNFSIFRVFLRRKTKSNKIQRKLALLHMISFQFVSEFFSFIAVKSKSRELFTWNIPPPPLSRLSLVVLHHKFEFFSPILKKWKTRNTKSFTPNLASFVDFYSCFCFCFYLSIPSSSPRPLFCLTTISHSIENVLQIKYFTRLVLAWLLLLLTRAHRSLDSHHPSIFFMFFAIYACRSSFAVVNINWFFNFIASNYCFAMIRIASMNNLNSFVFFRSSNWSFSASKIFLISSNYCYHLLK